MIVTGFEILDCPVKPGNDNKYVDGRDKPGHDELVAGDRTSPHLSRQHE
jgi:hypothetical protein